MKVFRLAKPPPGRLPRRLLNATTTSRRRLVLTAQIYPVHDKGVGRHRPLPACYPVGLCEWSFLLVEYLLPTA